MRVLDSRFVNGDRDQGVEHLVQQWQGEGVEPAIEWMSNAAWKELIGWDALMKVGSNG